VQQSIKTKKVDTARNFGIIRAVFYGQIFSGRKMNTTRILTALAFTSALSFTSHAELITTDTQIRDYQGNR